MVSLLHNNPATAAARIFCNNLLVALRCAVVHPKHRIGLQDIVLPLGLFALSLPSLAQDTSQPNNSPAASPPAAAPVSNTPPTPHNPTTPTTPQLHVPGGELLSRTGARVVFSLTFDSTPSQDLSSGDSVLLALPEKDFSPKPLQASWQLDPLERAFELRIIKTLSLPLKPTGRIERAFLSHERISPALTPEQLQIPDSLSKNAFENWSATFQTTQTPAGWRSKRWARGVFADDAELLTPFAKGSKVVSWTLSDSITLAGIGSRRVWDPRDRSFVVSAEAGFFISPVTDFQLGYQLLETSMKQGVLMPNLSSDSLFARFQLRF